MQKKMLAMLFAVVFVSSTLCSSACATAASTSTVIPTDTAAKEYQKGDVNMDGKIDVEDAQLVLQAYVDYFTGNGCILNDDQIDLANITGTTTMDPDTNEKVLFSGSDARMILVYWTFRDVTHEIEPDISIDDFYKDFSTFYSNHPDEIAFTEVALSKESTLLDYDEQSALTSCLILNMASLEQLPVQPSKIYTPKFFEDRALIMISQHFSCVTDPPTITSVSFSDNMIKITANRKRTDDDEVEWWCTFLEVSKSDLPEITEASDYEIHIQINTLPQPDEIAQ